MKTSNKILLAAISVIGLSMLSILIFAKSSLIQIDQNQNKLKGNGNITRIDHPIEDISMVEVGDFFELYVTVGEPKLEIETDENIQALLRANYDNYHRSNDSEPYKRVLKVEKLNNVNLSPTQAIKLFLAVPTLEGIDVDNHATVVFEDVVTSENFKISTDEFSNVYLKLNTQNLNLIANNHATVDINGTIENTQINAEEFAKIQIQNIDAQKVDIQLRNHVDLKLNGQTNEVSLNSTEFCNIDLGMLETTDAKIHTRNHSTAYLYVTGNLEVKADEFSNIKYRGNPTISGKYLDKTATLEAIQE